MRIGSEDDHEYGTAVTQPPSDCFKSAGERGARIDPVLGKNPAGDDEMTATSRRPFGRRRTRLSTRGLLLSLMTAPPTAMAACLSLQGSTACSAFQSSSVSTTDNYLVGLLYVKPTPAVPLDEQAGSYDLWT